MFKGWERYEADAAWSCARGRAFVVWVVNASASTYCSLDPTVGVGTPVKYSLNVNLLGSHVYVSGTSKTTTFGGGVLIPRRSMRPLLRVYLLGMAAPASAVALMLPTPPAVPAGDVGML